MPIGNPVRALTALLAGRLRFPHLFLLTASLFLLDLLIPDMLPFVDEILLGLGTVLLASLQGRKQPAVQPTAGDVTIDVTAETVPSDEPPAESKR